MAKLKKYLLWHQKRIKSLKDQVILHVCHFNEYVQEMLPHLKDAVQRERLTEISKHLKHVSKNIDKNLT